MACLLVVGASSVLNYAPYAILLGLGNVVAALELWLHGGGAVVLSAEAELLDHYGR